MAKSTKAPAPKNTPAKVELFTLPTDGNVVAFKCVDKANLLEFSYVESKTKTEPLTMSEAQLAELLRKGIFVKL
mgnify:FL=1